MSLCRTNQRFGPKPDITAMRHRRGRDASYSPLRRASITHPHATAVYASCSASLPPLELGGYLELVAGSYSVEAAAVQIPLLNASKSVLESGSLYSSFTSHRPLVRILSLGEKRPSHCGDGRHSSQRETVDIVFDLSSKRLAFSSTRNTMKVKCS